MNRLTLTVAGIVLLLAAESHAQQASVIYACVDANGRRHYTNVQADTIGKNCSIVQREVSVVPQQPPAPANRAGREQASRVDTATQKGRDEARRRILEDELGSAEKKLAEAKQKLAEQEAIRTGDERNYQRVLDRLKPFHEEVERQEQNVSQVKRELGALR